MTTTVALSPRQQAIYDRMLAERITEDQITDQFATSKIIPQKSNSKQAFCYRYKNVLPATTPLAEFNGSNRIPGNKIVREEVVYDVKHYGDFVPLNDEVDLYDFRNIQNDYADILGDQASLTAEVIRNDVLASGTNVIFADGATDRTAVATGKKIVLTDLRLLSLKLKNQGGKYITKAVTGSTKVSTKTTRPGFILMATSAVVDQMRGLDGWKDNDEYAAANGKLLKGEIGRILDFTVIDNPHGVIKDVSGTNVHLSIAFAKDAYATVSLRGKKKSKMIIKAIGSAGSADPLNQEGSIGWKMIMGVKIMNEALLVRLESTPELEDETEKHFYDHS
jgi:N4-gp56 family major capsid protein